MKLIFCLKCHDIVRLEYQYRSCKCHKSFGAYYADGLSAVIGGAAVPLGIHNVYLGNALKNQPEEGYGRRFDAFVIPKSCPTVTVVTSENLEAMLHDLPECFTKKDVEYLTMAVGALKADPVFPADDLPFEAPPAPKKARNKKRRAA